MAYYSKNSMYRTSRGSMFGGVCAGLSEAYNIDVTLLRIIFAVVSLGFGAGIGIYLILWLVLPNR